MIHFLCTKCKKALKAPDGTEGKTFKCNGCSEPQVVPGKIAKENVAQTGVIGFAQQDDAPLPVSIEIPTSNRSPIEDAETAIPKEIISLSDNRTVGDTIYYWIMVIVGIWCVFEWFLFFNSSLRHVRFLNSKDEYPIGESSFGTYALLASLAEPLACTMVFFVIIAIGNLKKR